MRKSVVVPTIVISFMGLSTVATFGQPAAEFYKGKMINVLIGVGAGGYYDMSARLVARHLGRHIPGSPTLVPQNMTGAGGARMAAYLAEIAPKDGTSLGMIGNNFPAMQAAGLDAIRFDLGELQWIGSVATLAGAMTIWRTAGVNTIDDARQREVIVGASGKGAESYSMPAMLNQFLKTRFKIVTGYQGGNAINLAMERGEVQGRYNFWASWKATKPEWIKNGDIKVLVTIGPRISDLPNVPSILELVKDDEDRQVIEMIIAGSTRLGTPFAFPGGVPPDRLQAVREAFKATMKDPQFLEEASRFKIEVRPVGGSELQKTVAEVLATPSNVAKRAKGLLE